MTASPPPSVDEPWVARSVVASLARDLRTWLEIERDFGLDGVPPSPPEAPPAQRIAGGQAAGGPGSRLVAHSPTERPPPAGSPSSVHRPGPRAPGSPPLAAHGPATPPSIADPAPSGGASPAAPRLRNLQLPPPAWIVGVEPGEAGLSRLRSELGDCRRCGLCEGRQNIVFGEGDPDARLMFVGEGPGYHEDVQGRPFVGKAGQLLDRMIVAMGLQREQVYIANVVKCHPPGDRDPEWDERIACRPFVLGQIQAVRPQVVVALGKVATQTLLETSDLISRLRGRFQPHPHFPGLPVMPTYHPAALLRNETLKRPVWEDLKLVMQRLTTEK